MKIQISLIVLTSLFAFGCGSSTKTTIAESDGLLPSDRSPSQTASQTTDTENTAEDPFLHVKMGELNPIYSLDPLFAQTETELRAIHLLYQGLTALGENGNVVPEIAKSWTLNSDSTQFTFILNKDIYYHDSNIFSSGLGRRVVASDVSLAFNRMGKLEVPNNAAQMFLDIIGFEAYQNEQNFVKNPALRTVNSIQGIITPNDSTVVFNLRAKSPNFLNDLAHPYASIYPSESFMDKTGPIMSAVGSGAFYFAKMEENRLILASNSDFKNSETLPNRLDMIFGLTESRLFQQFVRDEIDFLFGIAPEMKKNVADSSGQLLPVYESDYDLVSSNINSKYTIYYNPQSNLKAEVDSLFNTLDLDNLSNNPAIKNVKRYTSSAENVTFRGVQFGISQSESPIERYVLNQVGISATTLGATAALSPSFAVTQNISLTTNPFYNSTKVLSWETPIEILVKNNEQYPSLGYAAWDISFSGFKPASSL